jgi:RhtB (resistance to homoserine/threonine) family protein
MDTAQLLTVTLVALLAVISPGPDFVIVSRNSLLYSKKVGLSTAFGIALGTMVWIVLSLVGVSLVLSKAVIVFTFIKYVGATYLIYIGWKCIRAKAMDFDKDQKKEREISVREAFMTGFVTNLLNAKAALFFVSFFSVILSPETPVYMRIMYGAEISLIALVWFSLVATVLSIGPIKSFFQKVGGWFERVTGAVLVALGIKIAVTD